MTIVRAIEILAESEPGIDFSGSGDIDFQRLSDGTLKKLHRFVNASANSEVMNRCGPNKKAQNKVVAKNPAMVDIKVLGNVFETHWFTLNANMEIGSITHSAFDNSITIEMPSIAGQPKTSFIISQEIWMPFFAIMGNTRSFQPIEHGMNELVKCIDIGLDDGNVSDTETEIDTDDYTSESEDWDRRPLSPTSLHAALYNLYNH